MKKIKLTQGLYATVDDEDFERVNQYKWHASLESRGTKYYAIRRVKDPTGITVKRKVKIRNPLTGRKIAIWKDSPKYIKIRMHRFVLDLPTGLYDEMERVVDHIDHDSLNNQKSNLEIITQEENMRRSPGWKKLGMTCEPSL